VTRGLATSLALDRCLIDRCLVVVREADRPVVQEGTRIEGADGQRQVEREAHLQELEPIAGRGQVQSRKALIACARIVECGRPSLL